MECFLLAFSWRCLQRIQASVDGSKSLIPRGESDGWEFSFDKFVEVCPFDASLVQLSFLFLLL